jgi:hypothetical protein
MRLPVIATACCFGLMASLSAAAAHTQAAKNAQQSNNQKLVCKVAYHQGMIIRNAPSPKCSFARSWSGTTNEIRGRAVTAVVPGAPAVLCN